MAKSEAKRVADLDRRRRANRAAGIRWNPTLDDWFEHALRTRWKHVRPGTRERRQNDYRIRIRDRLGARHVSELRDGDLRAWLDERLAIDGNRRCVHAAYETLAALLALAVEADIIDSTPLRSVPYPIGGLPRPRRRAITMHEYTRLVAACSSLHERTIVRMLCEAGLRSCELVSLRIGDLHLDSGLVHVQRRAYRCRDGSVDIDLPKSRRPRQVAINESLCDELRRLVGGAQPDRYVWLRRNRYTAWRPDALTGAALSKLLVRLARRSGIHVSPHVLRATGVSIAVAAGVAEHVAAAQLGHSRVETTRRHYLHLPVIDPLRTIAAVFDDVSPAPI